MIPYPNHDLFVEPEFRMRHRLSWFKEELAKAKDDPEYGDLKEIKKEVRTAKRLMKHEKQQKI